MSPVRETGPSAKSRAATRVNAVRTAGWLLGHEVAFGGPTSSRVPSASASYGRGRFATFLRPWPASHAAPAAANAFAAARRLPVNARIAAAAPAAQIEPSSVTPVKKRSASGP